MDRNEGNPTERSGVVRRNEELKDFARLALKMYIK